MSGEEDGIQENREEEESSFLQEVLSSLKTPLSSCSLMTEGVDLEIKEEVKEREVVEMEGEEVEQEEEEEVVEPVGYQAAPVDSILSHQSSQEEVSTLSTASCQDVEQEESMEVKEEAALEEEELVVEEVSQYCVCISYSFLKMVIVLYRTQWASCRNLDHMLGLHCFIS